MSCVWRGPNRNVESIKESNRQFHQRFIRAHFFVQNFGAKNYKVVRNAYRQNFGVQNALLCKKMRTYNVDEIDINSISQLCIYFNKTRMEIYSELILVEIEFTFSSFYFN